MTTINLTPIGSSLAHGRTSATQWPHAGRAGVRLARALGAGNLAEAARLLRRCPTLRGAVHAHGAEEVSLGAGYASIATVSIPGARPGQWSGRGWALEVAAVLDREAVQS